MTARKVPFRQSDLTRAIRAALAAGLRVARAEIAPDGTIIIHHAEQAPAPATPFDAWKASLGAH